MSPLLLWWILGCSGRALDAPDPLTLGLEEVAERYEARIDPAAVDEAIDLGWRLLDDAPEEPRVLAALALAFVARGQAQGSVADLTQAYQLGRRCLARNPGWRTRLEVSGGRVVEDATVRLLPGDQPCLHGTLQALGHRMILRGPAGWVDLRELGLLAAAADQLDAEAGSWVPPWALGLSATLSPEATDAARAAGAASFREATRREPTLITAAVDRLHWVLARELDREALVRAVNSVRQRYAPVHPGDSWALENNRGLERLEKLLEEVGD